MFSSQLGDAITASLVSGLDPMNQIARQMFTSQAAQAEVDLDIRRRDFVLQLQKDIDSAISNQSDPAVVDGFRRLLAKHTGGSR